MALIVISGVAASGKSSLARALAQALGWPCLDADSFHPPANIGKMRAGQPLDETDREPWLAAIEAALRALHGGDAVLAFPGLKAAHRARIRAAAGTARFARLDVSLGTVRARLQKRGGFFPPTLAESQFAALEEDDAIAHFDGEAPPEALLSAVLDWSQRESGQDFNG